jgi:hypothetical protein
MTATYFQVQFCGLSDTGCWTNTGPQYPSVYEAKALIAASGSKFPGVEYRIVIVEAKITVVWSECGTRI